MLVSIHVLTSACLLIVSGHSLYERLDDGRLGSLMLSGKKVLEIPIVTLAMSPDVHLEPSAFNAVEVHKTDLAAMSSPFFSCHGHS